MIRSNLSGFGFTVDGRASVKVSGVCLDLSVVGYTLDAVSEFNFVISFTAYVAGIYNCRFMASGTTLRGKPFTREQTLTAAVWNGGDNPRTPTGNENEGGRPGQEGRTDCCNKHVRLMYATSLIVLFIAILLWIKL